MHYINYHYDTSMWHLQIHIDVNPSLVNEYIYAFSLSLPLSQIEPLNTKKGSSRSLLEISDYSKQSRSRGTCVKVIIRDR